MCTPGGDLSPLELADVNRDGLRDVLLSFVTTRNGTEGGKRHIFWRLLRGRCQLRESDRQLPRDSALEGLPVTAMHGVPDQKVPDVNKDHFKKPGPRMVVHVHPFYPSPQKGNAGQ